LHAKIQKQKQHIFRTKCPEIRTILECYSSSFTIVAVFFTAHALVQ